MINGATKFELRSATGEHSYLSSTDSDGRCRTIAPSQLQNEPTMRVYDLGLGTKRREATF